MIIDDKKLEKGLSGVIENAIDGQILLSWFA